MDLYLLGKTPIHPETPTGSDARYDPDFEVLQSEIDKLSSPSAANGVDWKKVSDTAARILSEKSKDLMAASYLAVGQIHLNQIDGFAVGATVLRDLLENYWETLYPSKKRMRGRIGALNFWVEKAGGLLETINATADRKTLDTINQALTDLEALLDEHLSDPPALHTIKRQIKALIEQSGDTFVPEFQSDTSSASQSRSPDPSPAPTTDQTETPSAPKPQSQPQPSPSAMPESDSGPMETEQDAMKFANAGFQALRNAGVFLFEKDGKSPDAYRYRRLAVWAKVSFLPPENNGKTQIPPPSAQEITSLKDLKNDGNWHVLLQTAEQKLSRFIFWFDLCRLSAEVLLKLGPDYHKAHRAVCDETAFFLHRLAGIEDLAFSDGMPFADMETRQWLKNIAFGSATAGGGKISPGDIAAAAPESDRMDEILESATSLASQQKIMEAVELVQNQLKSTASEKGRLLWRMILCQILLDSEFKQLSAPHLEQIVADIDNYQLEAWEPAVALQGLALAWNGFRSLADSRFNDRAETLLNRISRLDPAEALRLSR